MNYRKFAWWNTQWAFAGVAFRRQHAPVARAHDDGPWEFTGDTSQVSGQIKAIPDIPTTVMARSEASLRRGSASAALPEIKPLMNPSVRERWNDYGIGLLLQGDLKGAAGRVPKGDEHGSRVRRRSGQRRARAAPGRRGRRRRSRCCEQALEMSPRLAKAHFFLGTALKTLGRYDEALDHSANRGRAVSARPRRAEPDRPRLFPATSIRRGDRSVAERPAVDPRISRPTTT